MSIDPSENVFVTRLAASPYRDVDEDFIRFRDDAQRRRREEHRGVGRGE